MYSEKLEELISLVISDGILTDEKRDIIQRRAEKEGEDVEEVMMVVNSRLKKTVSQSIQTHDDEEEKEKDLLHVPENVVKKVLKIIAYYNKRASKWGYELLVYNADNHTISGKFTPKTEAEDAKMGLWKEMKETFKNGDLGEEWDKILKLCGAR